MAISDRRSLGRPLEDWLRDLGGPPRRGSVATRAGGALVDAVQLREKDLDGRRLLALATRLRDAAAPGTAVLVNGRADVALASGCAGVHLTSSGLPVAALRRRFGETLIIGCSTHRPEEVVAAHRDGADYCVFGPVFPTPSKAPYGEPPGLPGLRRAVACGLPVLAIGGIGPDQMAEVAAAGAAGVAGIRAFFDLGTVARMAELARRLWPGPSPPLAPLSHPPTPTRERGEGRRR